MPRPACSPVFRHTTTAIAPPMIARMVQVMPAPSADELAAYRRGTLALERFQVIDAWIATQPDEDQLRLLEPSAPADVHATAAPDLAAGFLPASPHERFVLGPEIGRGGMGLVVAAHDRELDRPVAIKRCRPRAPSESLATWALRLRAFRREAAITARLEHPAVVPVHDVGLGAFGEPAYVMKRLAGQTLDARLHTGLLPVAEAVEILLRVAEAVGHAHRLGIVHRDLKPANVVVAPLGEVFVLDWGLAGYMSGSHAEAAVPADGLTAAGVGTPAWMAPEQARGAAANPRQDVWALGGLLLAMLSGRPPRPDGHGIAELQALPRLPRGLAAMIRTCLDADPALRYADGATVTAELQRWLAAGVTAAERAGTLRRAWLRLRTSPPLQAGLIAVLALVLGGTSTLLWDALTRRQTVRSQLVALGAIPLDDLAAVRSALRTAEALHQERASRDTAALVARFAAAIEAAAARETLEERRDALLALATRYRRSGPWPGEIDDLAAGLAAAGASLSDPTSLASSPLRAELLTVLVHLQRALLLAGGSDERLRLVPIAIASGGGTPAWRGLGDLLTHAEVSVHDLVFCPCSDSEAALTEPGPADAVLAVFAPDRRLARAAEARLTADAGAFWPRIVLARAALDAGEFAAAHDHALVALGRSADSLWPHLILAYTGLAAGDDAALARHADAGLAVNPEHLELRLLAAVAAARRGDGHPAELLIADAAIAAHLRYHLRERHGHPMERAVDALVDAGQIIPDGPSELGPVVPHHH